MSSSRKYQKSLLAVAVSMVLAPAAYAADQNAAANYDRITGDTVVVTAARTQKALLDTDASMSVVTTKETRLLGRDNIADLLKDETGLTTQNDGTPGAKRIAIRGESSNRTLVMVNGDRISDHKTRSGAPLLMNPYFIDRIEVIKGPASVLYGSDAMGGIVNVITKQASEKPYSFEGGLGFNSASSSFTQFVNVTGTVDRFHYAVGAFNDNADDLRIAENERVDNTGYKANGANADISYDVTDKLTLGYNAEIYTSESEVSTTTTGDYKDFRGDIPKWDRMKHKLYLKATDLNDYVAAVDASIYYQTNDKDYLNWPSKGIDIDVTNEQKSIGGNLQAEFSLSDTFYLITGYEGRMDKVKAFSTMDIDLMKAAGGRPGTRAGGRPGAGGSGAGGSGGGSGGMPPFLKMHHSFDDVGYKQYSHAVYTMLSSNITDELTLNTGLRYNYIKSVAGSTTLNSTMYKPGVPDPVVRPTDVTQHDDVSDSKLIGSVGLVYRPFDNGAFRANWSQGFRAPTVQELFITTSTGEMQYGNPDLKPEESDNFELGFRWDDGALSADLAVFYTKADNYIQTMQEPQTNPKVKEFKFQNISEAETYGAEVSLAYLCPGSFEPYVNVAYMVREFKHDGKTSKNTGTPRVSGNAGLRYYGSSFVVDGYADFATNSKNEDIAKSSHIGAYDLGGYTTWNLSVSAKFGQNDQFTAYAAVNNIFDKSYMVNELIHEAGRNFSVGVRGQF